MAESFKPHRFDASMDAPATDALFVRTFEGVTARLAPAAARQDAGNSAALRRQLLSLAEQWAKSPYNDRLYLPRPGSQLSMFYIRPDLGCASSMSNLTIDARRSLGENRGTDYDQYFQVSVDGFERTMRNAGLVGPDSTGQPGDYIVAHDSPSTLHGHIGLLGNVENGVQMVYHHHDGHFVKEPLAQSEFADFRRIRYLRPVD